MAANEPSSSANGPKNASNASANPQEAFQAGAVSAPSSAVTAVQVGTPPSAMDQVIPLPPMKIPRPALTPEKLANEIARLDWTLVGLVLILSFFLASFAVTNADFWMHLATGRLIAQGEYSFGQDPFSHPATTFWANHSWLYDWLLYLVSSLSGGIESTTGQAVLITIKSLVAMLLAWTMLRIRKTGQSLWIPALVVGLSMVVISQRLMFQPIILSFLFLALTLCLLLKPEKKAEEIQTRGWQAHLARRPIWLIPAVFFLWVNTDQWFLLGPFVVLLFLVGEAVQMLVEKPADRDPGRIGALAAVLGIGLLACLLNPHHIHAFTLPPDLAYLLVNWGIPLPEQLVAAGQTLNTIAEYEPGSFIPAFDPLNRLYLEQTPGPFAAGWCFFALFLLNLATVVALALYWILVGKSFRISWFLVCAIFALISANQSHFIPFYAVVAGPITVLQIQELLANLMGSQVRVAGSWKLWSLGGRFATILGLLAIIVLLAWPGALHNYQDHARHSRHVAFTIEPDPQLKEFTLQLKEVHGSRKEPAHVFNVNWRMAVYCAWYAPEIKTYFDNRFGLFTDRAETFMKIRSALASTSKDNVWQPLFRKENIGYLVLGNLTFAQAQRALNRLFLDPAQWRLPRVGGISTVFVWQDPALDKAPAKSHPTLDMSELAFRFDTSDRSPAKGSDVDPVARSFLDRLTASPRQSPGSVEQADLYLKYHNLYATVWPRLYLESRRLAPWFTLIPSMGIGGGSVLGPAAAAFMATFPPRMMLLSDQYVPKGAPVLAVRAARRAVAENPLDARAHFILGQAYHSIWKGQEEAWSGRDPAIALSYNRLESAFRQTLRAVQVITAYKRSLALNPKQEEVHYTLATALFQLHYFDAGLRHLQERIRIIRDNPPTRNPKEKNENFQKRLDIYRTLLKSGQSELKTLETVVSERKKDFRLKAANKPLQLKVHLALLDEFRVGQQRDVFGRGLAEEALNLLLKAKGKEINPQLALIQVKLLLTLGRIEDARPRIADLEAALASVKKQAKKKPQYKNLIGPMDFSITWYKALIAAVDGNYDTLAKYLRSMVRNTRVNRGFLTNVAAGHTHGILQANLMRNNLVVYAGVWKFLRREIDETRSMIVNALRPEAEFHLLAALMALEHGDNVAAKKHFATCIQVSRDLNGQGMAFDDRRIAERYLFFLDAEDLRGHWQLTRLTKNGRNVDPAKIPDVHKELEFSLEAYRAPGANGTFRYNPIPDPNQMNLFGEGGADKGIYRFCIFAQDKDVLKISYFVTGAKGSMPARSATLVGLVPSSVISGAILGAAMQDNQMQNRPESFTASSQSQQIVAVYHRKKK